MVVLTFLAICKRNILHFISNVLLLLFGHAEITHIWNWETQPVTLNKLCAIYHHDQFSKRAIYFKSRTEIE